mmetsp:Transcript_13831/g.39783  ORF Transcript_13831/g.39783 Transcript_13831/m.39783 type:complete len:330 (+) Transcript_13831:206-1195(+)
MSGEDKKDEIKPVEEGEAKEGDSSSAQQVAGAGAFDMSAMKDMLSGGNLMDMAKQLAQDPTFADMTKNMQAAFGGGAPPAPGAGGAQMDPSQYMQAMNQMMQDPTFVQYSEQLYSNMMKDPMMAQVMQSMQNPQARNQMEQRMAALKDDPELKHVIEDMEKGGPDAMMKYWNDPDVLSKIGKKMQGVMHAGQPGPGAGAAAATEEVVEEEVDLHGAVSAGDIEACKELLKLGAGVNEKDEEGRSALHFACGYGELECAKFLIENGADVDILDNSKNSCLHYAAGYGEKGSVELLLKHKAKKELLNNDKHTAFDLAKMNDQKELSELLKV